MVRQIMVQHDILGCLATSLAEFIKSLKSHFLIDYRAVNLWGHQNLVIIAYFSLNIGKLNIPKVSKEVGGIPKFQRVHKSPPHPGLFLSKYSFMTFI